MTELSFPTAVPGHKWCNERQLAHEDSKINTDDPTSAHVVGNEISIEQDVVQVCFGCVVGLPIIWADKPTSVEELAQCFKGEYSRSVNWTEAESGTPRLQ